MEYSDWVKKLGQWHLSEHGSSETLCGSPMLGNNYAKHITVADREPCKECFKKADKDPNDLLEQITGLKNPRKKVIAQLQSTAKKLEKIAGNFCEEHHKKRCYECGCHDCGLVNDCDCEVVKSASDKKKLPSRNELQLQLQPVVEAIKKVNEKAMKMTPGMEAFLHSKPSFWGSEKYYEQIEQEIKKKVLH
jgi:hypothetical protein